MSRAQDIAEVVLDQIERGNKRAWAGVRYSEEPILYTGATMPHSSAEGGHNDSADPRRQRYTAHPTPPMQPTPPRIRQMRELAGEIGYYGFGDSTAALFCAQARMMEDYTDNLPFRGTFEKYYPTYMDIPERALRGYFTWRTRWREGMPAEDNPAPLSFLFVYIYELLAGVGVAPGPQGLAEMDAIKTAYTPTYPTLHSYLIDWKRDYVVYWGLPRDLYDDDEKAAKFAQAVCVLRATEESNATQPDAASQMSVFEALCITSSYQLDKSALYKQHCGELQEVSTHVFLRMVAHCKSRRKVGYVDGLFGRPTVSQRKMFACAVFFEDRHHADVCFPLSRGRSLECKDGLWWQHAPCKNTTRNSELGNLMHEADRILREALGFPNRLRPVKIPAYQQRIVREEVAYVVRRIQAEEEARAAAEAARVVIDRAALGTIRNQAAATRESLLTDEERGNSPQEAIQPCKPVEGASAKSETSVGTIAHTSSGSEAQPRVGIEQSSIPQSKLISASEAHDEKRPVGVSRNSENAVPKEVSDFARAPYPQVELTPRQATLLQALLTGTFSAAAFTGIPTLDMEVDAINEALYDLLGDVAIEYSAGQLQVVPDYEQDIREAFA